MIPLLCLMTAANKRLLPGAAALVGVIFVVFAGFALRTSLVQPKPDNLFYCMNAETGQALWASVDAEPDEWTANYFKSGTEKGQLKECLPQSSRTFLKVAAPVDSSKLRAPSCFPTRRTTRRARCACGSLHRGCERNLNLH